MTDDYPLKKSYIVEYWDCGYNHRHRLYEAAVKCRDKKGQYRTPRPNLNERNREIFRRSLTGSSVEELALEFKLSTTRIRDIFGRRMRVLRYKVAQNGADKAELELANTYRSLCKSRPYFNQILQLAEKYKV